MRRFQSGFTVVEFIIVTVILVKLAILGGLVYVAWHFLSKIW
jgi:Tfp pilus assembly protein PilE